MKIINLIKSEFIKNYTIKRFIIIFIVLIISSFFLVNFTNTILDENEKRYSDNNYGMLQGSIDSFKNSLEEYEKKTNTTLEEDYQYYLNKSYVDYAELIKDKVKDSKDFKYVLLNDELLPLVMKNYLIEMMEKYPEDSFIVNNCSLEEDDYYYPNEDIYGKEGKFISELCKYTPSERMRIYQDNKLEINELENLLKENKYYLYLEHEVKINRIENNKMVQLLISKKVEDSFNYLAFNYKQYNKLGENANNKIYSKNEYEELLKDMPHDKYSDYFTYHNAIKENANKYRAILLYSTEHEIKNSIHYNDSDKVYEDIRYQNTKLKVDYVLHLSVVVILLISITSGGIVSNEHNKGTIKKIITAPVRRWKILLSKFIYLILDTYIIWFIGLIIISIMAGLKYGFNDLFTPQLVYNGNKVIEVNYYLYLIKEIFIASIPVICFLSILFFLSTITLNTGVTVGISTFISVLSLFLWLIETASIFKYIVYTPLWYFDLGFIKTNSNWYLNSLFKVSYNQNTGIIISLITIIVLYIITNIIYTKRDIKN